MSTFLAELRYAVRMLLKVAGLHDHRCSRPRARHRREHRHLQRRQRRIARVRCHIRSRTSSSVCARRRASSRAARSLTRTISTGAKARARFTDLALAAPQNVNFASMGGETEPERIQGAQVSWNFIGRNWAEAAVLGRDFDESGRRPDAHKVAIVTQEFWQKQFGGAPDVLGKQIMVDGMPARDCRRRTAGAAVSAPVADLHAARRPAEGAESVLARGNHPGFSASGGSNPACRCSRRPPISNDDLRRARAEVSRHATPAGAMAARTCCSKRRSATTAIASICCSRPSDACC